MELAEGRFVPGFATGIVGMLPSQTKQIEVRFPDQYPAAELAGKEARFTVTLQELKELELPPIDDDFARAVSQDQTVAELREDLKRRLEAVAAGRAPSKRGQRDRRDSYLRRTIFRCPLRWSRTKLNHLIEDLAMPAPEGESNESELRAAQRPEAESRVKAALLIEAIAKAENIAATPADVSAELEALARRYGQPVARIRKALGNNVLSLVDGIVRNKTLDFLIDNAIVTVDEETPGTAS